MPNVVIHVPSLNELAFTDGLLSGTLVMIELATLILLRRKPQLLLVVSTTIILLSLTLLASRAAYVNGYRLVNQTRNVTIVEYTYAKNPFATLYIIPYTLGVLGIAYYVIQRVKEVFTRRRGRYGYPVRWGR